MKNLLACLLVVSMSGCPDVTIDPAEVEGGPTVEFDPARSQAAKARFIPFPNDLVRDPATGKINLSEQNCETPSSKATRENVLNKLDGFGTYQTAIQVTFTEEIDESTIRDSEGRATNAVMYQIAKAGTAASPATATPIPLLVARVGKSVRFASPDCNAPELVDAVTFVPGVPLEQNSTYFVALFKGIKNKGGEEFVQSYTWGLVSSSESPVTLDDQGNVVSDRTPLDPASESGLASLKSLAMLWNLHAPGLAFIDASPSARPRPEVLVGFQFTTQTVTDPLDPAVTGSPASKLPTVGLLQPASVTGRFGPYSALCGAEAGTDPAQCFLKLALGGCSPLTTGCSAANYAAGTQACALYNCAAVGDVIGGGIATANFQMQVPNTLEGGAPIQGAWSDPIHPEQQASLLLETIIVVPSGNPPMNGGWPTVVFDHGLGSSKESVFAIAGRLAQFGFATVAIDTSAHGSRAVRTSRDINLGCIGRCFSGTTPTATECDTTAQCGTGETCGSVAGGLVPPSPTTAPQCYAPFLSTDLATTRDGIRQTILDLQRVVLALKSCGAAGCGDVRVNPSRIYYAGMSLGAILGTTALATAPDLKGGVLNVGGVGLLDVLENTQTLQIRCSLVNGLIDAGVLQGEKWTGGETGLCTTDEWKTQPGYGTFATIGRWVLDPADPANFASRAAAKRVLIQEVVGDTVVPNVATDRQAALMGLAMAPLTADPFNPGSPAPSAAITTMPNQNKFVRYVSDADHVYVHSSLLRPAPAPEAQDGINATLRLQLDAATFLFSNNQ